ncbi:class I SAM-dependent methyltransferase [Desulfobacterota bacterium AH_259_B03_O07]|nr:class I SAM-dependent methyltransferase [Desulfobacterota bacterium AH_259_B03_O07]
MYHQYLYSNISKFYDLFLYLNNYKRAVDYFVKHISLPENQHIRLLDVGAGTGLYTLAIFKRFPNAQVTAIDISENMIKKLQTNVKKGSSAKSVKTIISDATKPIRELEGDVFDLIVAGGLLEYVDPDLTVRNLTRYLKTGGLFFNSPVKNNFWGRFVGLTMGFKPYSKEKNRKAFTDNCFTHIKELVLPIKYFPISLVKEGDLFRKDNNLNIKKLE